ncbi:hypothetical protein D9758_016617 [Tetrapyrgos nigripes]|uniref:Uncharacterized protein n=1 Tax=Tetrapyrgos nigripes TaxID=182062 RepID=A0A8H5FHU5_9AGAR|nr:hypothetical protein D9758_016617 [Tetrapyrgos nigripes]
MRQQPSQSVPQLMEWRPHSNFMKSQRPEGGPTLTATVFDEVSGILVASAAGFELEFTELKKEARGAGSGTRTVHNNGQYGCSGEEGGEGSGRCSFTGHLEDWRATTTL